ncbi:MAG: glycoside hydrolase family 3 C-terminal domain-containing protein [Bacteroidales bacterium]
MKKILILCTFFLTGSLAAQRPSDIKTLLGQLSLEEKAGLVVGAGMNWNPGGGNAPAVGVTQEKVPGAAGTSNAVERLGIPKVVFADGPAGVRISPERKSQPERKFYATAFPVGTLMASTFDPAMVEQVGAAFGNETKEYGVDFLLAPALNIHRNPLGGRNFEYYSEDPVVSGNIAAAFTTGVQSQGVGVSLKHFAANNQETNRQSVNTIVSERALREIYLKGFEIAVKKSDPWTIMSSYNKINEVYASESHDLLTTILRDEWGFKGFVMTDWFGGKDPVAQMKAGNDLLMPGGKKQVDAIVKAVQDGSLSMEILDLNVARILEIYNRTPAFKGYAASGKPELELHKQVARQAAGEGMVLLKNEKNTLPFDAKKGTIALFGNGSYQTIAGGTGSGDVNKAYMVSIADGLVAAGFTLNETIAGTIKDSLAARKARQKPRRMFMPEDAAGEMNWTNNAIMMAAENSSAAVVTLTRTSGEFFDRKQENDFNLNASELSFLKQITDIFHQKGKPVILVLNIGGVIETASWKNLPDAILLAWQPGQEGGHAVADILSGKVNPSGKLPMSFPVKYSDVPSSGNFPGRVLDTTQLGNSFQGVPSEVIYEEDIFVGYRYYDTYGIQPSYPFGFGLSYTSFKFSGLKVEQKDRKVNIECSVTNTGKTAGKEVVQLYLSAPAGKLKKPSKELKAFAKTKLLAPGEKQTFTFTLTPYEFASFDAVNSAWIVEPGTYGILIGSSSADMPLTGKFVQKSAETVLKTHKALAPSVDINILK